MTEPNEIVGHKTFRENGQFRHEPLTRSEADALHDSFERAEARRAADFPDAEACARGMWEAYYRMKRLGWKDPRYAPTDGRLKRVVSAGSSGIHEAYCSERTDRKGAKWWWAPDDGDLWSYTPLLYLPDAQEIAEHEERMTKAIEKYRKEP